MGWSETAGAAEKMGMMPQRSQRTQRGFTLIELLAAVAVLMIIGLILANVFHQSTIAWEAGLRRVEMSAEGRAAIDLMAYDISQAVASMTPAMQFAMGSGFLTFFTSDDSTGGNRALRRISYGKVGSAIKRWEETLDPSSQYPTLLPAVQDTVVENVVLLSLSAPPGFVSPGTNPPAWVDIEFTLRKATDASVGVRAWSLGRDGVNNTGDDVKNYK